jgi:beta-N-acetylhexosaminidase
MWHRLTFMLPAAIAVLALSCGGMAAPPSLPPPVPLDTPDESWVQATLAGLSLEERVGQMLMVRVPGSFENMRGTAMRDVQRLIRDLHVGALFVEPGSPHEVAANLNQLQRMSRLPLLAASDLEASAATAFPPAMGLGATGDPLLARLAGRITAVEARATGIHWLLAPGVAVSSGSGDAGIDIRSFGSDAGDVSAYASAFVQGAGSGGALTTAMRFPVDDATPSDAGARAVLAAGIPTVMVGHAPVAAPTNGERVPASLSPAVGTRLLRGELGFTGVIVTDAMDVPALRATSAYSPGEVAVRAVEAGADVVMAPPDPTLAHRALVAAVRGGRIHYARVDSSVARILRAKASLGLHRERTVALDSVSHVVGAPEHGIIAADVAARSLTLVRDPARLLPLDPRRTRRLAVVAFAAAGEQHAGAELADALTAIYGSGVSFVRVDETTGRAAYDSAAAQAARADATIFAVFPATRPGATLPSAAYKLAERVRDASDGMIVVSFGDPVETGMLPGASTYLLAWQQRAGMAERAVARAIAGHAAIPGRMPVKLPGAGTRGIERPAARYGLDFAAPEDVGMDAAALARVDTIVMRGIISGAAPGVAIAIGRHGRLVRLRGYGTIDRRSALGAVTDSTLYDLASITKVVATTTALMMLVEEGVLGLDDPVRRHVPEWRGSAAKESVTLRNLLLHDSGLPAYAALWNELSGRDAYRRRIAAMSYDEIARIIARTASPTATVMPVVRHDIAAGRGPRPPCSASPPAARPSGSTAS